MKSRGACIVQNAVAITAQGPPNNPGHTASPMARHFPANELDQNFDFKFPSIDSLRLP